MSEDLWRLLEMEAAATGVSTSQYIREAALARAAAAAAARGTGPFTLLAGAIRQTVPQDHSPRHRQAERVSAELARLVAALERDEARALRAESSQAMRRRRELSAGRRPAS